MILKLKFFSFTGDHSKDTESSSACEISVKLPNDQVPKSKAVSSFKTFYNARRK
jgi:hypothetical protein